MSSPLLYRASIAVTLDVQNTMPPYTLTADTLIAQTAAGYSETSVHVYQTTAWLLTLQKQYKGRWGERRELTGGGTNHCIFDH
jgi:hypothetical protein